MPPNPQWITWITSSFVVYFKTQCVGIKLPLFIVGETRDQSTTTFAEFRLEGPYFNELTKGYWKIEVYIALLLTMINDENDLYKAQRIAGQLLAMFDKDIPIFRYNEENTMLGCMRLVPNEKLIQTVYGPLQPATPVTQSSIEAHYHMEVGLIEEKLSA